MPIIKILNREYQIACGPGEEAKLLDLASKLNARLQESTKTFRGANELMLLVLTALTLEDSEQDSSLQIDALTERVNSLSQKILKK